MRMRAGLAVIVLALGVMACDENGEGANGEAPDGGSTETVSRSAFVAQADDACSRADDALGQLDAPAGDLTSSELAPAELETAGTYVDHVASILEGLVTDLDDMAQPAEPADAEEADTIIDDLGRALESLRAAGDAARDGDAGAFASEYGDYVDRFGDYSQAAQAFGLDVCGRTP